MLTHLTILRNIFPLLLLLLLSPLTVHSATQQDPPLSTVTLYHSSSSHPTAAPEPLAILSYLPHRPSLSKVISFTPPPNVTTTVNPADALTQIILYLDNNNSDKNRYRSSATATYAFHPPARGRFRLNVADDGTVLGASWWSWIPAPAHSAAESGKGEDADDAKTLKNNKLKIQEEERGKGRGRGGGRGEFDLVMQAQAPRVVFDRPKGAGGKPAGGAGGGLGGSEEEVVEEKTMFQKYWWVLVAVALLAMTGGGGDK